MAEFQPLRILLVQRSLPAHVPGGLERHGEDLALGLAGAGCQVAILTAPLPEAERARYAAAGIVIHSAPCAHPKHYTLNYLRHIGAAIERVLATQPFDVIHAQEFALGFWRPRPGDPPLVLTVHGTITSETPLHPDVWPQLRGLLPKTRAVLHYGRRFLYLPAWRRALGAARRIVVDSAFTEHELKRLEPALAPKIRRIALAVRETGPEPPKHVAARNSLGWSGVQLLTLGRLEWAKGHELALEALAGMKHLAWQYHIGGTGGHEDALRKCVVRLGLEDRVSFTGRVDEATKHAMLAAADLFLWPERAHPAFGLAGLEALLAGTPVLATRRGAIPEVLGAQASWFAEECTAESFALALRPLLVDPTHLAAARKGLRAGARTRFDYGNYIAAMLGVYREALGPVSVGRVGTDSIDATASDKRG